MVRKFSLIMQYYLWRFIHNFVAHGILWAFIGEWDWTNAFHDWTAHKMEQNDKHNN